MKELQILSPDGKSRMIPLENRRITLGRSNASEICFPEDNGLSRQHLAVEPQGSGWLLRDLGSKNGTTLNGTKISAPTVLKQGDRIMAGHLILIFDGTTTRSLKSVVLFDPNDDPGEETSSSTVVTNLQGVFRRDDSGSAPSFLSEQVAALIQAGNELSGDRPLPELFRYMLDLGIKAVKADRGIVLIVEDGDLVARANKGEGFRISSAVRDRVLNSGESILVRDMASNDAFRSRHSIVEQQVRTLMAVPLQAHDRIIGLIYVDSPSLLRQFTKDDLDLLTVMANVAAIRIENARLAEIEQSRKLMARELEQAAEIQRRFLPSGPPKLNGLELAGHNAACRTVGGDYYDFFPYPPSRVGMVLGDVSGKGMPASLLMMGLQARVQVLIEEPADLADVMTRLNRITAANCPSNRFISLFFCILEGASGDLTYCNAGHNPPVLVRADGTWQEISGGGPVLGILGSIQYQQFQINLAPGDTFVIYSDGVTEAPNAEGEEFDVPRLAETVARNRSLPAAAIVKAVNRAVEEFTGGAPPSDDITLIIAKRTDTGNPTLNL